MPQLKVIENGMNETFEVFLHPAHLFRPYKSILKHREVSSLTPHNIKPPAAAEEAMP